MIKSGLLIKSPWIDKILAGEKTWEIRDKRSNKHERIGLIQSGSGTIVGTCCVGPLSADQFKKNFDKHRVTPGELVAFYGNKSIYAYVLSDVRKLGKRIPYTHKPGAVQFVRLTSENVS